jgi:hypothetical protein
MAIDKSYITVPKISFTNVTKTGFASTSVIATGSATTDTSSTTEVIIDNEPRMFDSLIVEIQAPTRESPAEVQSSGGGSSPDGLGDTLDNGPDNSRLGGTSNGGGTPSF